MPALCRDCLTTFEAGRRCPACHGPRVIAHPELFDLNVAHMDCDAFYASVEKRDNPDLAALPVIIGGGRRGVVSTACYIARIRGVHSAMPMFQALKLCPDAVVIKPRMQAYAQAQLLASSGGVISQWGLQAYFLPTVSTVITLTAGTMLAVWLGELINEMGVGQGLSIIIFGNIVARIPQRVGALLIDDVTGLLFFILITIVTVFVIVVVQEGQRRIPVQYGKRVLAMRGNRLRIAGGQSTHIPLRVNTAGMIPLIFASSILLFPGVIAQFFVNSTTPWVADVASTLVKVSNGQSNWYYFFYFWMVVGFTYFYGQLF